MAKIDKYKDWLSKANEKYDDEVKEQLETRLKYYRGDQWNGDDRRLYNRKSVDNIILTNISTIIPSIFYNNPKVKVTGKTPPRRIANGMYNPFSSARYVELLLDYYIRELDVAWQVRRCLYDAEIGPWGIMQIGYTVETDSIEGNEFIKKESPFMVRRSPRDLRVDPACTDHGLASARYIALRWVKRLEDIKKDPRYTGLRGLKPNVSLKNGRNGDKDRMGKIDLFAEEGSMEEDGRWNMVEGWDIWDSEAKDVITLVQTHDKLLGVNPWPMDYEGFPVETLYYDENPDELFPLSPVDADIPIQDELNRVTSLQLDNIRSAASQKMLANRASIDPQEIEKLENGPPNTVALVDTGNVKDVFTTIQSPNVGQDVWMLRRQLKSDNRENRGISDAEAGGINRSRTSAAEVQAVGQGVGIKRMYRRAALERFLTRCMKKVLKVVQQSASNVTIPVPMGAFDGMRKADPSRLMKIIGEQGQMELMPWLQLSPDDLMGDYDFAIEVGSTQPKNDKEERVEALTLMNTFKGAPFVNEMALAKNVFDKFVDTPEAYLKPEEQMKKEREEAMQAKQAEVMGPYAMKRETDLQKTQMKTQAQMQSHQMGLQAEAAGIQTQAQLQMAIEKMKADTDMQIEALKAQVKLVEKQVDVRSPSNAGI